MTCSLRSSAISIHALREEGDFCGMPYGTQPETISIHALREEGDPVPWLLSIGRCTFLSTPSARRATELRQEYLDILEFLSTPSARRATGISCRLVHPFPISIHALREEGDPSQCRLQKLFCDFYPRPPRGGRRKVRRAQRHFRRNFYPRPPRGGRLSNMAKILRMLLFLSTPSARRATPEFRIMSKGIGEFLSTPSARRATKRLPGGKLPMDISINALREEGDAGLLHQRRNDGRFLSTPSARRATHDSEPKLRR